MIESGRKRTTNGNSSKSTNLCLVSIILTQACLLLYLFFVPQTYEIDAKVELAQVKWGLEDCPQQNGRKILIDLGANCGNSYPTLKERYGPFDESFLWELNPWLQEHLTNLSLAEPDVTVVPYGAWFEDDTKTLDIYGLDLPKCELDYWSGTTFVQETNHNSSRYKATVSAEVRDFSGWYYKNICQQDNVTLKVDIEKAEYVVMAQFAISGLLCHPKKLLVEFHPMAEPLETHQYWKQKSSVYTTEKRKQCFAAGFVSTMEQLVQYCPQEPELFYWE
eukprot:TRINITY_DN282_c0_g1_i2.p2 TRINITY_DN282_c0_g1~~TRINITY_DN282_c0_g1_i2.p2  ORF type:complete len:314 (-),score=22.16 TRINITY_DN282_c0_g1_i2:1583-2413(-)